jgi:Ca2+/Na+ antiporter
METTILEYIEVGNIFAAIAGIVCLILSGPNNGLRQKFIHKYSQILLLYTFLVALVIASYELSEVGKIICAILITAFFVFILRHPKFEKYKKRIIEKEKLRPKKKRSQLDKLVDKSKEHLDPDENVCASVLGIYSSEKGSKASWFGVLLATNKRIFFYANGLTETTPYSKVASCGISKGMFSQKLTILSSGNKNSVKILGGNAQEFLSYVRSRVE